MAFFGLQVPLPKVCLGQNVPVKIEVSLVLGQAGVSSAQVSQLKETLPDSRLYYIIIFPPLCFTLCLISGGISLSSVCLLTYALMLLGSPVNRSFSHPL